MNKLVSQKANNRIIDTSNFVRSKLLTGHHRNTYVENGNHSIACSENEEIENLNLLGELEKYDETGHDLTNHDFLIEFSNTINNIMIENEYYSDSYKTLKSDFEKVSNYKLINSFITMNIFKRLTGVQWIIKL